MKLFYETEQETLPHCTLSFQRLRTHQFVFIYILFAQIVYFSTQLRSQLTLPPHV